MQKKIQVVTRTQTITANTTLMPEGFGGWLAQNKGTANVKVDGFELTPNSQLDLTNLPWYVTWNAPLTIEVEPGGVVRIMRLKYNEVDE